MSQWRQQCCVIRSLDLFLFCLLDFCCCSIIQELFSIFIVLYVYSLFFFSIFFNICSLFVFILLSLILLSEFLCLMFIINSLFLNRFFQFYYLFFSLQSLLKKKPYVTIFSEKKKIIQKKQKIFKIKTMFA